MGKEILISVIIPAYNGECYIERALDSVFTQTMLPYELIVVDDGSLDKTVDVVEEYYRTHNGIINKKLLIKQKNLGAGAARNTGIEAATGNWISFLDSDDTWDVEKIEQTYEAILGHERAKMISHDMIIVENGDYEGSVYASLHDRYKKSEPLFTQLYYLPFLPTPCVTIKKELLSRVGMFDTSLRACQDWDLWLKSSLLMNDSDNLVILDKGLFFYLTRKGSISYNTKSRYECGIEVLTRYRSKLTLYMTEAEAKKYARKSANIFVFGEAYSAFKRYRIKKSILLIIWYIRDIIKGVT